MRKRCSGVAAVMILYFASMLAIVAEAAAAGPHAGLSWQGSQTCLTCHEAEAREVHGSSHYQWQGPTPYTVNGPEIQGKLETAFNSYCVSILGNWNACGSCHVGLGAKPEPDRNGRPAPEHRLPHLPPERVQAKKGERRLCSGYGEHDRDHGSGRQDGALAGAFELPAMPCKRRRRRQQQTGRHGDRAGDDGGQDLRCPHVHHGCQPEPASSATRRRTTG